MIFLAVVVGLFTLAAIVGAFLRIVPLWRARNKRELALSMLGTSCDAAGPIGFSLLCSGVRRLSQIENLLSSEYVRCEVVVVVDAALHRAFFETLVARYRLIRVEYLSSDEFPVSQVRSVWRSRRRCFRRVVLLDRPGERPSRDWNAAASVASFDLLVPVCDGQYLLPGALERLSVEVGQRSPGEFGVLRSRVGEPFVLLSREAVAAAGGFAPGLLRKIPRRVRISFREPVFFRPEFRPRSSRRSLAGAFLFAAALFALVRFGYWPLVALLFAGALLWVAQALAARLVADMAGRSVRCKISVKNFTDL